MAEETHVIRLTSGHVSEALSRQALGSIPHHQLARFLAGRRWFGAKARACRDARVATVLAFPWPDGPFALAVVEVDRDDGRTALYQLPLTAREAGDGQKGTGEPTAAVLATVESVGGRALISDATGDEAFRRHLAEAILRGTTVEAAGIRWVAEPVNASPEARLTVATSRLGSAEQSNSSIIYGDGSGDVAILKLFRRIEPGESPDIEIARFLATRTDFRNTPELLGTIRLEFGYGEPSAAGMLSRFVPSTGDAWSHALDRVRAYLAAPAKREPSNPFAAEARELGRVTRALHEALASDEVDP
ncbi:MAG: hypothetical protein M3387_06370, partial [Actinomycetota bacterium]|nr:hypothetical protein [Actinomycetota bacterium]